MRQNTPPNYERLFERIPWFRMSRDELLLNQNQISLELDEWLERGKISKARYNHYQDLLEETVNHWLDVRANYISEGNIENGKGYRVSKTS